MKKILCTSLLIATVAWSQTPSPPPLIDDPLRQELVSCLTDLSDWIMTLDVGSGALKNTKDTSWSIFINGNFARVLMAAHKLTGKPAYLTEALRWCDSFVGQQQPVTTSTGEAGGYWGDHGPDGNLYLADSGTAATALALGYKRADRERQKRYLKAMERFARFVRTGCREDPQGQARGGCAGWVIREGKDKGALGCGYYRGHLSRGAYIISSATNAGAFMSLLHSINRDPELKTIAADAVRWILSVRASDGELPYIIEGQPTVSPYRFCTMTYCSEGIIAAHTHLDDAPLRGQIGRQVKPCIEWLLRTQNADGSWGEARSADQQRSPGVVTLLAWYYRTIEADPRVASAVRRYCRFVLNPDHSKPYGVKTLVRTTGFVGLAVAELIEPLVTFK
ncbi:MAG: hypothetical protein FJ388_00110 [Verrucomicrobia bacterium]|nr:hypothetical protein [Verrucomicrobiota bacterium]